MEAIVHIGIEKTGTTAIQSFLAANREMLKVRGILFPQSLGQPSHRYLAILARDEPETDRLFDRRGITDHNRRLQMIGKWQADWDRELAENRCALSLISSEHLHSTLKNDSEIKRLSMLLRARFTGNPHIIVYIRDQLDQLLSARSTALKSGSATYEIGPAHIYRGLDYQNTIERWSAVFGEGSVSLRLYDPACWVNGDLISDFMTACRLEMNGLERPGDGRNVRLDALGQRVLRSFNRRIAGFAPKQQSIMRDGLIAFAEQHFSQGVPAGVTQELIDDFRTHFAGSNEWVRARFFPTRSRLFSNRPYPVSTSSDIETETERMISAFVESWIALSESKTDLAEPDS